MSQCHVWLLEGKQILVWWRVKRIEQRQETSGSSWGEMWWNRTIIWYVSSMWKTCATNHKGTSRVSPAPVWVSLSGTSPAAPGSFIVGSESTFAEDAAGFWCQLFWRENQKIQRGFVMFCCWHWGSDWTSGLEGYLKGFRVMLTCVVVALAGSWDRLKSR